MYDIVLCKHYMCLYRNCSLLATCCKINKQTNKQTNKQPTKQTDKQPTNQPTKQTNLNITVLLGFILRQVFVIICRLELATPVLFQIIQQIRTETNEELAKLLIA